MQFDERHNPITVSTCQSGDVDQPLEPRGASAMKLSTIGIDLAHGANAKLVHNGRQLASASLLPYGRLPHDLPERTAVLALIPA
jgi:hypothetical protein